MARATAFASLLCEAGYDLSRAERLADICDKWAPVGMSADDLFSALLQWRGTPRPLSVDADQLEQEMDKRRHRARMFATMWQYWSRDDVTTEVCSIEAQEELASLI